jgi:predicted amino acid-binding ACT domain protein
MENADLDKVRDILARDLNAVGQAVNVDIEGVFLELVALADNIEQLPMIKLVSTPEEVIDDSESKEVATSTLLDYLGESLSQLVRIRQHDQARCSPDAAGRPGRCAAQSCCAISADSDCSAAWTAEYLQLLLGSDSQ